MNENVIEISKKNIKKDFTCGEKVILRMNVEIPQITSDVPCSKAFNSYYKNIACAYEKYCEKVFKKIKNTSPECPYGEVLSCIKHQASDGYVSVIIEVSEFDSYFTRKKRFSRVWDLNHGRIIPINFFLEKYKISEKQLKQEIKKKIVESLEIGNRDFHLSQNGIKKYCKYLDKDNFFITDKGIGIFFQPSTISNATDVFPTFIIEKRGD